MTFPTFPHLENLDKVPQVLESPLLLITNKVDGFNARFGWDEDREVFRIGTRNNVIYESNDPDNNEPDHNLAQGFAYWAWKRRVAAIGGYTYFGEWAGKGIQKRLDYGPPNFHLFAVWINGTYDRPRNIYFHAEAIGVNVVEELYYGKNPGVNVLDQMRSRPDTEGIVLWPWPPILDARGGHVIAKFKNPAFSERTSERTRKERPDMADIEAVAAEYVTHERMLHVFQSLQESGIAEPWQVEHTGEYLRAMHKDVQREAKAELEAVPDGEKNLGKVIVRPAKALRDSYLLTLLAEPDHGGEA